MSYDTPLALSLIIAGTVALGACVVHAWRHIGVPDTLGLLELGDDGLSWEDDPIDTFGDDRPSSFSPHIWAEFDSADKPFDQEKQ